MNEFGGYAFADLRVGMCATFAKTVTEAYIVLFAAVRRQQRHPHQRGVRGRHHFQGPHCPWNAVGKHNLRGDRGRSPGRTPYSSPAEYLSPVAFEKEAALA